jgi:vitamin B12 transporter
MKYRLQWALLTLCSTPIAAWPQAGSDTADTDYVVTASRRSEPAREAVRPVTVITAQDIRASGVGSLTELLRTFGGLEVTSNGGLGQSSSVFLRGANSDHTVVLVDGVRIGSTTLGTASFESIPLGLIERVEILSGPSSSLYGSDAIGGVIQIFTRSAQRSPGASVALTTGSHGLRSLDASLAARSGDNAYTVAAGTTRTDGFNVTTPANFSYNPDRDGYRNSHVLLGWTRTVSVDTELGAKLLRSEGRVQFDSGAGDAYSDNVTQTISAFLTTRWLDGVATELRAARSSDDSSVTSNFPGRIDTTQDQVSFLNRIGLAGGTAMVGVEWLRQAVDSSTAYDVAERRIPAVLLGWRGHLAGQDLQADVRRDDNSQFGGHTTGQLGWAWLFTPDWRVRASAGTAFHAPTFNQLYYPGFGNPELRAERSRSTEIGLDGKLAGVDFGATVFDNRIRDLIDFAPPTFAPANVAKAHIRGLSLQAQTALGSATRAKFNATFQEPKNGDTDYLLRRRARAFGGLSVTHSIDAWRIGAELAVVGHRFDSANESPASRLGGYGLVNAFVSWTISPNFALDLRVDNVGAKDFVTAQTYVSPGRRGQVTLRWTPAL